jgi:hypothetical protein
MVGVVEYLNIWLSCASVPHDVLFLLLLAFKDGWCGTTRGSSWETDDATKDTCPRLSSDPYLLYLLLRFQILKSCLAGAVWMLCGWMESN